MSKLSPVATDNAEISTRIHQAVWAVGYVWAFAAFVALGTKGCDWISEPSNVKVILGLASVMLSVFGVALIGVQVVQKVAKTWRGGRAR